MNQYLDYPPEERKLRQWLDLATERLEYLYGDALISALQKIEEVDRELDIMIAERHAKEDAYYKNEAYCDLPPQLQLVGGELIEVHPYRAGDTDWKELPI